MPFIKPPKPDYALAKSLLAQLKDAHWDNIPERKGMHAYGYMPTEQEAIDIVVKEAVEKQGMRALSDLAGNVYLIKEGTGGGKKTDVIVSHLDTVEKGGAHDGRDGIAAGIAVVAGMNKAGVKPLNDVCIMIARSEESCVNGVVSIGAKLATGGMQAKELKKLKNRVTKQSVFKQMQELHIPVATLVGRLPAEPTLFPTGDDAKNLIGFLAEAHIEQGNYCARQNIDVGIVTHIRGNTRFAEAKAEGMAAHSGSTHEEDRADAMRASVALMAEAEKWFQKKQKTHDVVYTLSIVNTKNKSTTTIADNGSFSFEIRSSEPKLLNEFAAFMQTQAKDVEAKFNNDKHQLKITLPKAIITQPAKMDQNVIRHVHSIAKNLGINSGEIISGAGHDTAQFANSGVPSVMIFIKQNYPISHNPREAHNVPSFKQACDLLAGMVMNPQDSIRSKPHHTQAATFTRYLEQQGAKAYTPGQWQK